MPTSLTPYVLIPTDWNPSDQLAHWLDISPAFTLPQPHAHYVNPSRGDWTLAEMLTKGVTHWSKHAVQAEGGGEAAFRAAHPTNEYNDVPRIRDLFPEAYPAVENGPWWPNGFFNEAQARAKGDSISIAPRLWIGETMEGDDYVPEGNVMWKWFYEELMGRYIAQNLSDGKPFLVCHNYFTRFGSNNDLYQLGVGSQANQQAMYSSEPDTWPATDYHPGGSLSNPNLVMLDLYLNDPEGGNKRIYQALFHMELLQKMYFLTGIFWFDVYEWFPGFATNVFLPTGTFERSDKAVLDPSLQMLIPVLAHEYGVVSVEWGIYAKNSNDKTRIEDISGHAPGKDRWYPGNNASNPQTYPSYALSGSKYQFPAYLSDFPHFGLRAWNATCRQTVGGTNYYARYRLDGGTWVEPVANKSDTVRAYYEQKYIVKCRILSSQMSVFIFNLFADNLSHTIEFEHPTNSSLSYTMPISGIGPHLKLIAL